MKKCTYFGLDKEDDCFRTQKRGCDSLRGECKDCEKLKSKTPYGRASRAWRCMKQRAENKDGDHPTYQDVKILMTKEEFMDWAVPVYENKIKENPEERWTIDRINGGNYEIGNLQVISGKENSQKRISVNTFAPEGTQWCSHCKQFKPFDDFYPDPRQPKGFEHRCKLCCAIKHEKYRRAKGISKKVIKVTDEQAEAIRLLELPQKEIAEMYGICSSTVSQIKSGKRH